MEGEAMKTKTSWWSLTIQDYPNFKPNEKIAPGKNGQVQITFNGSAMGTFTRATTLEFSNSLIKQTQFSGEGVAITTAPSTPIINSPNKQ